MAFTKKELKITISLAEGTFTNGENTVILPDVPMRVTVDKTGGTELPKMTAEISNLSLNLMQRLTVLSFRQLQTYNNVLKVEAGEGGKTPDLVFQGEITSAVPDFNDDGTATFHIEAASGFYPLQMGTAPVSVDTDTTIEYLFKQFADEAGYTLENNGVTGSVSNCVFTGSPIQKARQLAKQTGVDLLIDNNTLVILPSYEDSREGGTVPLLSKDSGLLGYPSFSNDGISARCLFIPLKLFGIIALAVYILDDLIVWAKGGKSAYEDFWNLFGDGFKDAIKWIVEFIAKNKEWFILFLMIVPTLVSIARAMKGVFAAVKAGTAVVKVFGLALHASIGPYVLALLAIVAVLAVVVYYWDDIRKAGIEALSSLMAWCTEVGDKIREVTDNIKQWWADTWQALCDGVELAVEFWKNTLNKFGEWIGLGPFFGKGEEQAIAMAPGAETNISKTLNNEQTNNVTIYGEASKETVGNAVAGASENGWKSMVDSGNYG